MNTRNMETTTAEEEKMNKPTTGEWTEDSVLKIAITETRHAAQAIADSHNAILAAEREAGVKALAERSFELHECQEQLAAEREKVQLLEMTQAEHYLSDKYKLDQAKIEDLQQQLAAERENVNAAVEALKEMPKVAYKAIIEGAGVAVENLPNELQCIADAALARIGEKP